MADVFVSYAREEHTRAEQIRRALEGLGLTVFFDVERLDAGEEWSDVIDRELKTARAVVALWSPHALTRPWVRKECALAQSRGVLLPALLEPVSDLDMPVQFAGLQRVDLWDFHGQRDHPGWRKLVRALAKVLKRNDLLAAQIEALKEEKQTARVKGELAAAQKELEQLRKSKGGVRPAFVAVGLGVILLLGGAGVWWGVVEMGRRSAEAAETARAELVDPEVVKALSAISDDRKGSEDARRLLDEVFEKVSVARLIQASTVDRDAALLAGWAYEFGRGGVSTDAGEATQFYELSCHLGNERGCGNLGYSYQTGAGVPEDGAKATLLYRQACDRGAVRACVNLGVLYRDGKFVAKDQKEAVRLFDKACSKGVAVGCGNLGVLYETGQGVLKDIRGAMDLFSKACNGGDPLGCNNLGVMYFDGAGVAKDTTQALNYFSLACDNGDANGCSNVGSMYRSGEGAPKDLLRAQDAFKKACDAGHQVSCLRLALNGASGETP